jgi:hypothetical protein
MQIHIFIVHISSILFIKKRYISHMLLHITYIAVTIELDTCNQIINTDVNIYICLYIHILINIYTTPLFPSSKTEKTKQFPTNKYLFIVAYVAVTINLSIFIRIYIYIHTTYHHYPHYQKEIT